MPHKEHRIDPAQRQRCRRRLAPASSGRDDLALVAACTHGLWRCVRPGDERWSMQNKLCVLAHHRRKRLGGLGGQGAQSVQKGAVHLRVALLLQKLLQGCAEHLRGRTHTNTTPHANRLQL